MLPLPSNPSLAAFAALLLLAAGPIRADESDDQAIEAACGCLVNVASDAEQPAEAMTDAEWQDLVAIRNEERLAHDVYVTLGKRYDVRPFQRIPFAEQRHHAAVDGLYQRYSPLQPADAENTPLDRVKPGDGDEALGKFADPAVQELFDSLVERGNGSRLEALKVGALIEEMDIRDLRTASARTDKPDVKAVYAQLEQGSHHHLQAFMRQIEQSGGNYTPAYLSDEAFQAILSGHAPIPGVTDCASNYCPTPGRGHNPGEGHQHRGGRNAQVQ